MYVSSILAQESNSGGSPATLLIFLLIPVVLYFLLIRPQRRRMKQQAELQSSIGVGDEVMTQSGIYGFITGVDDDKFWLEIDDDVQIRIAKGAIQGKVGPTEPAAAEIAKGSTEPAKTDEADDAEVADEADGVDDPDTK
jgi:preprotein translocase subunit YajC